MYVIDRKTCSDKSQYNMNLRQKLYRIVFLAIMTLVAACHKYEDINHEVLDRINDTLYVNTHAAIAMADSVLSKGRSYSDDVIKRVQLTKYKAEDKCYIEHTSDSLILALVDYFERNGNDCEIAESYYYTGSTYRDMRDFKGALKWYDAANKRISRNLNDREDSLLKAMILSQYSDIHHRLHLANKAYQYMKESFDIQEKIGIADMQAHVDIARMAEDAGEINDAARYYRGAITRTRIEDMDESKLANLAEPFAFFCQNGGKEEVLYLKHFVDSVESSGLSLPPNIIASRGHYESYFKKNYRASVRYYEDALRRATNIFSVTALTKRLHDVHICLHDTAAARKYAQQLVALQDSINMAYEPEVSRDYRVQMADNKDYDVGWEENGDLIRGSVWTFSALAALAVYFAVRRYMRRRKPRALGAAKIGHGELQRDESSCMMPQTQGECLNASHNDKGNLMVARAKNDCNRMQHSELYSQIMSIRQSIDSPSMKPRTQMAESTIRAIYNTVRNYYPDFEEGIRSHYNMNEELISILFFAKLGLTQADTVKLTGLSAATVSRRWRTIENIIGISMKELPFQ